MAAFFVNGGSKGGRRGERRERPPLSWILKFFRMRTPWNHLLARPEITPLRFSNRMTAKLVSWFTLWWPRELAT
jgi:hypothetical protein